MNAAAISGTIVFGTTNGTTGNDNNTVDHCDIRNSSATPYNAIYAQGSTTSAAHFNSGITISNNNIFDFYCSGGASNGILVTTGNNAWTISGNSFYQTAVRTSASAAATQNAINISNGVGYNFTVSGNFIGGDGPNATVTTNKWTLDGAYDNIFNGILFEVGTSTASSIQGNTIANLVIESTRNTADVFSGIHITAGTVNIGTVAGNTIGNSAVSATTASAASIVMYQSVNDQGKNTGIYNEGTGAISIANNHIGGVYLATKTDPTNKIGNSFYGIRLSNGNCTVNNNVIGSETHPNSIYSVCPRVNPNWGEIIGIYSYMEFHFETVSSYTSNKIKNISYAGNGLVQVEGFRLVYASHTVTSNTVSNLSSTSSTITSMGTGASVLGICMYNFSNSAIDRNTIYNLSNNAATGDVKVIGIWADGTTPALIVSRNFIYSLSVTSSNAGAGVIGITFNYGGILCRNNMIAIGNGISTGVGIYGIQETNSPGREVYNNTVYIGGSNSGTQTGNTYAFYSSNTDTRSYKNNVFVNERSNSTTGGKHYAALISGTGVNPAGLTMNFNLYRASGTGGVLGYYNGDITTLEAWRTAIGQDGVNALGNPNFVNPVAATPDLHLQGTTPAEGSGLDIASVTDDFDGEARSGLTPVDLGADAGNFTASDIFPPYVVFTPLQLQTASTDNLTFTATIRDATGVPVSGTLQPRVWFRRSLPTTSSWASSPGTLQSGTGQNGTWQFTIDYTQLGFAPSRGDSYQYYVVAQDLNSPPYITSEPAGCIQPDVNTQTAPPGSPYSYRIWKLLSGDIEVGTGKTYVNLTGAAGLFKDINDNVLIGDVTVKITSALSEDGANALNQWIELNGSNYYLTIQPAEAVNKTISGNYAGALISLNGADRVIIDGNFNGSGQYLTFSNTNATTSNNTIYMSNTANNCTIKNCKVYSKKYAINIASSDNILIEGNDIYGDLAGNSLTPQYGIFLSTATTNARIRKNLIHDFYSTANNGVAHGIYFNSGDASTVTGISNNAIYNIKGMGRAAAVNAGYFVTGICIASGGNLKISNNSVYLSGDVLGLSAAYYGTGTCIYIHSGITQLDIRNNILQNSLGKRAGSPSTPRTYLVFSGSANTAFTSIDYNDYYFTDQPNVTEYIGYQGGNITDLAGWKAATGQDVGSYSTNPNFTSVSNLQPSGTYYLQGTVLTGITTDILGITRLSPPSLGAYDGELNGRWNGSASTDWAVAGNWDNDHIPSESENVYLSSPPVNQPHVTAAISSPLICKNITVYSGAKLTIDAGKVLTVTGTLTNNSGNDGLVIASDATGSGSLMHTSAAVPAKVNRFFPGISQAWHFLSSPVAAQAISPAFTANPSTAYDFFAWYEPTGVWVNFKNELEPPTWNTANGSADFVAGKGYLVEYLGAGLTKQFAGNLNCGIVTSPLSKTGTTTYATFNLLGNPYPSAIDWKAAGWDRGSLFINSGGYDMYIWNDAAGNYCSFNSAGSSGINGGTQYIAAGQGFMVKAASAGTLGMTDAIRVHNTQPYLKSTEIMANMLRMKVTGNANSYSDEIVVEFGHQTATGGAEKMFSFYETAPSLYTVKPDGKYSIDFRGEPGAVTISMSFKAGADGNYTLTSSQLESFSSSTVITLEDLKLAKTQNLMEYPIYSFTASN